MYNKNEKRFCIAIKKKNNALAYLRKSIKDEKYKYKGMYMDLKTRYDISWTSNKDYCIHFASKIGAESFAKKVFKNCNNYFIQEI